MDSATQRKHRQDVGHRQQGSFNAETGEYRRIEGLAQLPYELTA